MKSVKLDFNKLKKHTRKGEKRRRKKKKKDKDLNQISPHLDAKSPQFNCQKDQQQNP
jgi:hypothetical protein